MKGNTEIKILGFDKFKACAADISDLKDQANQINSKIRQQKLIANTLRNELNSVLKEIEKMEKNNK